MHTYVRVVDATNREAQAAGLRFDFVYLKALLYYLTRKVASREQRNLRRLTRPYVSNEREEHACRSSSWLVGYPRSCFSLPFFIQDHGCACTSPWLPSFLSLPQYSNQIPVSAVLFSLIYVTSSEGPTIHACISCFILLAFALKRERERVTTVLHWFLLRSSPIEIFFRFALCDGIVGHVRHYIACMC
jgi:hypothetical protein